MNPTVEHFSHRKHPLELRANVVFEMDATCYGCNKPVVNSPTYTCSTSHDQIDCKSFYLHKSCAELPTQITNHKHSKHPLTLVLPRRSCFCNACGREWKMFTYTCDHCEFNVCIHCAFEQRVLRHEGHEEHTLIFMPRAAYFRCDACGVKASDSSYVCTTCDFWIHKKCALSPFIVPDPTYHHHSLKLMYSVPDMHRYFNRNCFICDYKVHKNFWLYYCHKCTIFVHMKCVASSVSIKNEITADAMNNEPDLVQLPLSTKESLFDLIVTQCGKLQVNLGNSNTIPTLLNDPHIIEEHWSHKNHHLEQLHFTSSENDDDDNNDDERVLTCDGCIQPITIYHPSYYSCIQCSFFLHSFCATQLPQELPAGASLFHPQHSLFLQTRDRFYFYVRCGACNSFTNGFYYHCETCNINIDIRCAFLPGRIKHKSHKHHSLTLRPFSQSICSLTWTKISAGMEYACETCKSFQIDTLCVFYPSRMKHKYDDHSLTLRHPLFFYEGVFYCEICEEQVNNQCLLYHCGECDHSFHHTCLGKSTSFKFGRTLELNISYQPHTMSLVLKRTVRRNSARYFCSICKYGGVLIIFFECGGCGILICPECVTKILGQTFSLSTLNARSGSSLHLENSVKTQQP